MVYIVGMVWYLYGMDKPTCTYLSSHGRPSLRQVMGRTMTTPTRQARYRACPALTLPTGPIAGIN